MDFPIKVEIRAKASSHYTRETIERRLAAIAGSTAEQAVQERNYLNKLLEKK